MSVNLGRRRSEISPDAEGRPAKPELGFGAGGAGLGDPEGRRTEVDDNSRPVENATEGPEVVEVFSDDEQDSEPISALSDFEDIEITGATVAPSANAEPGSRSPRHRDTRAPGRSRRRPRQYLEFTRNVRPDRGVESVDDDIQIVDERPVLPLARFGDSDEFRLALLGRFGTVDSPIGTFEGAFGRVVSVITGMNRWRRVGDRNNPNTNNQNSNQNNNQNSNGSRRLLRRRRPVRYPANTTFEQFELPFLLGAAGGDGDEATAMERSIMERIERENDRDLDGKLRLENVYNTKQLKAKQQIAAGELRGYTNSISGATPFTCELCGVQLGSGIPGDFSVSPKYDACLERYSRLYRVQAPWFCSRMILAADIDLSKRVFVAKCGHVYCGRCIKNIGNRPRNKRATKKLTIDNPGIFAPKRCPAPQCNVEFRGKRTFTELYF